MSGYPHNPQGYGYGPPPPSQPYSAAPYGAAPPPPGQQPYAPVATPYGAPSAPYAHDKPPKEKPYGGHPPPSAAPGYPPPPQPYGSPFAVLVPSAFPPSAFPPGTDPSIVECFRIADQDGSGLIDDKELQRALSSYNQGFSLRTVHLIMYLFTNPNSRKIEQHSAVLGIFGLGNKMQKCAKKLKLPLGKRKKCSLATLSLGPKEFAAVFYSLQNWRGIFERFDRDRNGKIDSGELREALLSLEFSVSPVVLELLVSKFDKAGVKSKAIEYDNFIECCLTVKGLTEKFKEKDTMYSGLATFTYESFMLTVLPFLIA